ncbi:sodium-coupled monocarboxylate transporter 1-like [Procambarus clarkii]|uniref:sodium-coupled monocarboxylate transporter 1-like n=1 Tax=Procambarus clarkii TaxID=6728 RepID=UPI0037446571
MSLVGSIFGILMIRNIMLPVLYPLHLVSMFEYIELRFKSRALRKIATGIQLLGSFVFSGICLYAPSLTLSSVTSLPIWASVVTMGLICSFYITIGGVKAVVYTDVVQTLLMFGGVLVVSVICCQYMGGPANVWAIADQGGRIEFFNMDTSPFERHTFWSTLVLGVYMVQSMAGFNQAQFQRFISVKSLQLSQLLCSMFLVGLFMLWSVFYFSGLIAYAVYRDCDPLTSGRIEKPDQIVPYLVTDKLRHLTGMSGLFVAAVYGGVLSSLSSQGNAMACIIWVDFLKDRPYFKKFTDRSATNIIKLLSTMMGVIGILLGLLVGSLGTIFHVTNVLQGAIRGPLAGMFLTGICAPWVGKKGAAVGVFLALVFNMWLTIGKFVRGGGHPEKLPLSTLGCPENLYNNTLKDTLFGLNDTLSGSVFGVHNDTGTLHASESSGHTMYDISYCYIGVISVLNTIIISSIVSFITGPLAPGEVDPRVVNATCARLYRRLWGRLMRKPGQEPQSAITPEEKVSGVHMLPPLLTTDKAEEQTTFLDQVKEQTTFLDQVKEQTTFLDQVKEQTTFLDQVKEQTTFLDQVKEQTNDQDKTSDRAY